MKKILGLFVLFCSTLLVTVDASALSLSLIPSSLTADQGDTFFVDLVASDLGTDLIDLFVTEIRWDNSVISLLDASVSNHLGVLGIEAMSGINVHSTGIGVDIVNRSYLDLVQLSSLQNTSTFSLATLQLQMDSQLSQGESTNLFFGDHYIRNANNWMPIDSPTLQGATVSATADPTPNPEPATLLIIGSAFGVFAWKKRKNLL